MATIEFRVADITELAVDGIVCPAHKHLIKGRGLSAQVFERAGEALAAECAQQAECAIGDARITKGYLLPAKYVIHAVTPMWSSGDQYGAKVLKLLSSCYQKSLHLAKEHRLRNIALSALGAGNNRTPLRLSASVGLAVCQGFSADFEHIIICSRSKSSRHTWLEVYNQSYNPGPPLTHDGPGNAIPQGMI